MTVHRVETERTEVAALPWGCGALWVSVRPNLRRVYAVAGDILSAMGIRRDIGGKGRNQSEDVRLAAAWLRGYDVQDLILVDCQRLHPLVLRSVAKLAATAQVDLWLLHRPPTPDPIRRALLLLAPAPRNLTDVPGSQTSVQPRPPVDQPHTPAVPRHDAHVFLAAVHAELPPDAAVATIEVFSKQCASTQDRIDERGDIAAALAEELAALVRFGFDDSELITRLRAMQVVAWNHDLHVSVDLVRLLNSAERSRVTTDEASPLLLSYRQPYRTIAWVLAMQHVGLDDAVSMPLRAASPSGASLSVSTGELEVAAALRPAVRAQLHLRASEGAGPDDTLLPYHQRTLSMALTEATRDLGVPGHGRLAERATRDTTPWLRSLGIVMRSLP